MRKKRAAETAVWESPLSGFAPPFRIMDGAAAIKFLVAIRSSNGKVETKAVRQNVFVVQFSISWLHRVPSIEEYTLANCLIKLREAVFGDFISFPFTPN